LVDYSAKQFNKPSDFYRRVHHSSTVTSEEVIIKLNNQNHSSVTAEEVVVYLNGQNHSMVPAEEVVVDQALLIERNEQKSIQCEVLTDTNTSTLNFKS